jgi:ketosteroid isomerase-like protein
MAIAAPIHTPIQIVSRGGDRAGAAAVPTVASERDRSLVTQGGDMSRGQRCGLRILLAVAAVFLLAAPGIAGAGNSGSTDPVVAEAMRLDQTFVELFNARKWDELGTTYYAEDAIAAPPNHEPIRGRAAIIEYMRGSRNALGDIETGPDNFKASVSGSLVSVVAKYAGQHGRIRVVSHELFERQPDGSLKCTVDMFGFRDPAM